MNKYLTAYYNDEEDLLEGLNKIQSEGIKVTDVLTPFPVHGLDKVIGLRRSRLSVIAFIGGALGTLIGFFFQAWVFTVDYPLAFGGKPFFAVPSFMPVTFEMAVLLAAYAIVFAYLIHNNLGPGSKNIIYDERVTDDRFLILISLEDKADDQIKEVETALENAGALGITLKV
ncbi:MAG: DUF3341 domain-containing protein [Bacteroidales bacterium]|jgi:hypothetical protein|nr:DUF3341 domain-containing protein [Bacteroidales bacterium]MDD3700468.1 DUF3341 domain-containing protein [Bacteroidales bacterium]MDY0369882.1 DUF3341 domain-containing protein [Bacteroidales bacterium]